MEGRIADWQAAVARARGRQDIAQGVRLEFARDTDAAALVELAVAEQGFCPFFTFAVGITADAITLEVTGPDDARAGHRRTGRSGCAPPIPTESPDPGVGMAP